MNGTGSLSQRCLPANGEKSPHAVPLAIQAGAILIPTAEERAQLGKRLNAEAAEASARAAATLDDYQNGEANQPPYTTFLETTEERMPAGENSLNVWGTPAPDPSGTAVRTRGEGTKSLDYFDPIWKTIGAWFPAHSQLSAMELLRHVLKEETGGRRQTVLYD